MALSGHTNSISARTGEGLKQIFEDTGIVEINPAIFQPLIKRLVNFDPKIQNGRLVVSLNQEALGAAGILIEEVAKNQLLRELILFNDNGTRRSYDDVVCDVQKNPAGFIEMVKQEQGFHQPLRILITPPVRDHGKNSHEIACRDVPGSPNGDITLKLLLETKGAGNISIAWGDIRERRGKRHAVLVNYIELSDLKPRNDLGEKESTYYMKVDARIACTKVMPAIGYISQGPMIYDHTF